MFEVLKSRYSTWKRYSRTVQELESLTSRELADLGIRWADFCGAYLAGNIIGPDPANNPGDRMFQEVCMIARHYEAIRKTPEAIGEPETADHLPPADVAAMVDAKLDFNAKREDHKIENRLKEDGKRT